MTNSGTFAGRLPLKIENASRIILMRAFLSYDEQTE
jgi:hypothetical protein